MVRLNLFGGCCHVIIFLALTLLYARGSEITKGLFLREPALSSFIYTDNVVFATSAYTHIACSRKCLGYDNCVAFTSSGLTLTCQGYSTTPHSLSPADPSAGAETWKIVDVVSEWREQSCVTNTECLEANWECFKGQCLCTPGYYYSLSTKECILDCPSSSLQATYMKYPNSGMYGSNMYRVDGTVDDCKAACSFEPQCLTFEYEWSADGTGLGCYLQDMTAITYPEGWIASEALWDQYQRHCS